MSSSDARGRRVSGRQLDILWEFLNSHRDVAVAYNRSLQAKEYSTRKWKEIADILNSQGEGAHKDWRGWSKYWVDYKAKLKKRAVALRSSHTRTGGGPSSEQPLSEVESKFLQILGEDLGQGMPGILVEPMIQTASVGESPASQSILEPSAASQIISVPSQIDPPIHRIDPSMYRIPEVPFEEHSLPVATSPNRTPTLSPPPSTRSRRRRRRRDQPMTQEAARHALVYSSQQRVEAAVRSSQALQGIERGIASIQHTLLRIERTINAAFARAPEQEHFG